MAPVQVPMCLAMSGRMLLMAHQMQAEQSEYPEAGGLSRPGPCPYLHLLALSCHNLNILSKSLDGAGAADPPPWFGASGAPELLTVGYQLPPSARTQTIPLGNFSLKRMRFPPLLSILETPDSWVMVPPLDPASPPGVVSGSVDCPKSGGALVPFHDARREWIVLYLFVYRPSTPSLRHALHMVSRPLFPTVEMTRPHWRGDWWYILIAKIIVLTLSSEIPHDVSTRT